MLRSATEYIRYIEMPLEFDEWAGGTQGAKWFRDELGQRWIVKTYPDPNRVSVEVLAAAIYERLGIPVPEFYLTTIDNKLAYIAKEIPGFLLDIINNDVELSRGFLADVLVANWDVVGLVWDNIVYGEENLLPHRVDFGGSFTYRAQGDPKDYPPIPNEHITLIDPDINYEASYAFDLDPDDLQRQANEIRALITPDWIDKVVDSARFQDQRMANLIKKNLKARVNWIVNQDWTEFYTNQKFGRLSALSWNFGEWKEILYSSQKYIIINENREISICIEHEEKGNIKRITLLSDENNPIILFELISNPISSREVEKFIKSIETYKRYETDSEMVAAISNFIKDRNLVIGDVFIKPIIKRITSYNQVLSILDNIETVPNYGKIKDETLNIFGQKFRVYNMPEFTNMDINTFENSLGNRKLSPIEYAKLLAAVSYIYIVNYDIIMSWFWGAKDSLKKNLGTQYIGSSKKGGLSYIQDALRDIIYETKNSKEYNYYNRIAFYFDRITELIRSGKKFSDAINIVSRTTIQDSTYAKLTEASENLVNIVESNPKWKNSLDYYQYEGHEPINTFLWGLLQDSSQSRTCYANVQNLDKIMIQSRLPGIKVYRGFAKHYTGNIFDKLIGNEFINYGFTSTTLDPQTAVYFGDILTEIIIPEDFWGIWLPSFNLDYKNENEVLLPRGTRFVVEGYNKIFRQKAYVLRVIGFDTYNPFIDSTGGFSEKTFYYNRKESTYRERSHTFEKEEAHISKFVWLPFEIVPIQSNEDNEY